MAQWQSCWGRLASSRPSCISHIRSNGDREAFGLSREEAIRLNGFNLALLRQLETNLKMQMEAEEREQTVATLRLQMQSQIGVWWPHARMFFSSSFVDEVDSIIRGER